MSFRDTNLDDSPKDRVLELAPGAKCEAVFYGGRRAGYLVILEGKTIGRAVSAYQAWLDAEAHLPNKIRRRF